MNIFFLDSDVKIAAKYHVDSHTIKMRIELAQLLCTAHRLLDGKQTLVNGYSFNQFNKIYKKPKLIGILPFEKIENNILYNSIYLQTHINHPSAVWVRQSLDNYLFTVNLALELCNEISYRFNTQNQKVLPILNWLFDNSPKNIPNIGFTTPLLAMDDKFKIVENNSFENSIINYRNYYSQGKQHLYKWTNREKPFFLTS